jgi:basic membrane protein A
MLDQERVMSINIPSLNRRAVVAGLVTSLASLAMSRGIWAQSKKRIAALFAGAIDDKGFMQSGYTGFSAAATQFGVETSYKDRVKPEKELLAEALRELAHAKPDLVIAHGGQNNGAAQTVAAEMPDVMFVVTQGNVTGPNLSSYEVLQEHSAFLAGALAALTTKTGTVGHMSGIRVTPGLKGRAAYAAGVKHANPNVKLLTNFSGNQDDNALSKKVAAAMIAGGADIIFTMLNAGRTGAIDACREQGAKQIGNVRDWVASNPDVFVGSAIADSGLAVLNAMRDVANGSFKPGVFRHIGLEQPDAVRLVMASGVPVEVRTKIEALAAEIVAGRLTVPTEWSGEEFANPV